MLDYKLSELQNILNSIITPENEIFSLQAI